jgi:Thiamine pyrophosphate enzyme, N-terminal TPP binding domain
MGPEESSIGRRNFLQMTGVGIVAASAGATAAQTLASNQSADSESSAGIVPQPLPEFTPDLTKADITVETLISWGATHCFGVVGDGINSIIEALRKRQYVGVRHEEVPALCRQASRNTLASSASASAPQAPARFAFSTAFTTRTWMERRLSRLPG